MATIPMGNFGYAAPEVGKSQMISTRVQDNSAGIVARTIGNAVQGITKEFSDSVKVQAELEARAKRNKASTLVNEFETKLQAAELDLERQHAEGTVTSDSLLPAWEATAKKLREEIDPFGKELDEATSDEFSQSLESTRVNGLARFQGTALNAAKKDHQSSVVESLESFRKANLGNAVAAEAWLDGEGGEELKRAFGADAPEMIRKFKEQSNLDAVNLAIAKAGDDPGALAQVRNSLASKEAQARLDPDRLIAINSSLSSRIDSLNERAQAKAERELIMREKQASDTVNDYMKFITEGNTVSVDGIDKIIQSTKGTSQEAVVGNLLKYQDGIKKVLDAPAAERTAYMENMRRTIAENGSTPEQAAELKILEGAVKSREALEIEDPHLAYEYKTGDDRVTVDPESDTIGVSIAIREARALQAGTKDLLRPNERKNIAEKISSGSPDQRLQQITAITSKMSPEQSIKVMSEVGKEKDAGHTAYAGILAAKGKDYIALKILKGDEVIKTGSEGMVSKSKFADSLPESFGLTFAANPQARADAIEVAYRYYLSSGKTGAEAVNSIQDDAQDAIEKTIGKSVRLGQSYTLMPDGYDEDLFSDNIQKGFANRKEVAGLKGDYDDYQYTPVVDRKTGKTVYRVDIDGAPVGSVPTYIEIN